MFCLFRREKYFHGFFFHHHCHIPWTVDRRSANQPKPCMPWECSSHRDWVVHICGRLLRLYSSIQTVVRLTGLVGHDQGELTTAIEFCAWQGYKTGIPATHHYSFSDICDSADHKLFQALLHNPDHVLHQLLPPVKTITYELRPRAHDREIPRIINSLFKKTFTNSVPIHNRKKFLQKHCERTKLSNYKTPPSSAENSIRNTISYFVPKKVEQSTI